MFRPEKLLKNTNKTLTVKSNIAMQSFTKTLLSVAADFVSENLLELVQLFFAIVAFSFLREMNDRAERFMLDDLKVRVLKIFLSSENHQTINSIFPMTICFLIAASGKPLSVLKSLGKVRICPNGPWNNFTQQRTKQSTWV